MAPAARAGGAVLLRPIQAVDIGLGAAPSASGVLAIVVVPAYGAAGLPSQSAIEQALGRQAPQPS